MIAYLLIYKISQLFCIMGMGYIIVRAKLLRASDSRVLSVICLYLLMPAIIICSFDVKMDDSIVKGLLLAFCVSVLLHIIFLLVDTINKKVFKAGSVECASVMYPNMGNLVIPITSFVLGEEWVLYSGVFLAVQNIFLWTHGIRLFSESGVSMKKIIFNPNIIAVFIGIFMLVFGIRLPEILRDVTSSMGNMIGNFGMLICGMIAAEVDFRKNFTDKRIYRIVFLRMIIIPIAVFLLVKLIRGYIEIENTYNILLIALLSAMTPPASAVTQFAQLYDADENLAVGANIVSTLICIVTMPLLVMFY